jgi:hypothetical protein
MFQMQKALVTEHINDLYREGEALRAARRVQSADRLSDHDVGRPDGATRGAERRGVRVRLGHWLIGVGTTVAGPNGHSNGATGRAA